MKKLPSRLSAFIALATPGLTFALEHGSLNVVQLNTTNNNQTTVDPAVAVTIKPGATPGIHVRGHNRGDIDMQFGDNFATNNVNGVMITSVTENGRNNVSGGGPNGTTYATSHSEISGGGFYLPIQSTSGGTEPAGEFNINVAAAWFPYAEGWLGAHASAGSTNGGPLTTFLSHPSIRSGVGMEFTDLSGGLASLNLSALQSHGVPATSANGVLLVIGGKNEGNFALSSDNADGSFSISVKDNASNNATAYEQDGLAFAYAPVAAAGRGHVKAVGRVQSDGSSEVGSANYTITKLAGVGQWLLQIPGQTESTGTLIISADGGKPPTGVTPVPNNTDNFVCYQWDTAQSGWVIQSRDLSPATLEDGATADEDMFSFVFLTKEPAISLTHPVAGTIYPTSSGQQLTLTAAVTTATPAAVQQVNFMIDGVSVGTDSTAPYEITIPAPLPGYRFVEAFATLEGGSTVSSVSTRIIMEAPVNPATPPGSSLGIIDGGDREIDPKPPETAETPPNATPNWQTLTSTNAPLAFTAPDTTLGAPAVNINGSPVPFNSGILFATNYAGDNWFDTTTRGSIDNFVIPRNEGGNYALATTDVAQDGQTDPVTRPESSRFALGFFPYANGWTGANVNADATISSSTSLPVGIGVTNPSAGNYLITGLPLTGNMIAISSGAGTGADNVSNVGQTGISWTVVNRDNSQNVENGDFSFLYIPYETKGVYSGRILNNGTLVPLNGTLDAIGATTREVGASYEITFGDGSVINPSNTQLFITADHQAGNGGDNIYSYYAEGNKFMVFSHDLPGVSGSPQAGGFRFLAVPLNPVATVGDEVYVKTTDGLATENSTNETVQFTFTRTGNLSAPLTVNYTLSGDATSGTDYIAPSGSVSFAAGSATATVDITINTDSQFEFDETVTIALAAGSGYTATSFTASATIQNAASLVPVQTVSFQNGIGGYTGTFTKHIGKNAVADANGNPVYTNTLGSATGAFYVDGFPGHVDSADQNALVRFDGLFGTGTGQIPPGAKIAKAELVITTNTSGPGGNSPSPGPFVVDRLLVPVDANTTYAMLDGGLPGLEGVRGASSGLPVAGFGSMADGQVASSDVTSIVRYWADELAADPSSNPNMGFSIFTGGTADGWQFCTEGNTNANVRPKLVISYVTSSISTYTFAADKSVRLDPVNGTTDGSTFVTGFLDEIFNATQEAIFRFPVEFGAGVGAIPEDEEIVRAELVLTTCTQLIPEGNVNAHSPGGFSVHRMLTDWDTSISYGPSGPIPGVNISPEVSRATGMGQTSAAFFDVTNMTQAWRAGYPNHGISVRPDTTDGWQIFFPGAVANYPGAEPVLRIITAETGTATAFQLWAETKGAAGISHDSDNDRDRIPALVEYALGLDPRRHNTLPGLVDAGANFTLSFPKGTEAKSDGNLAYRIVSSTDLIEWNTETGAVNGTDSISLTVPKTGKKFFRLDVAYGTP
ncbi:hypothetical protein OJ996_18255 [Luteolibacter sp. GHJ8]|uniref:Calx-beta domain-containing protein n=1 Tax=Luteolibacter rhizosphaerae TaxID=2989719 RepID=A0ABT3G6S5_9BACT|nr:Calx-beta domain-containing protein [Luteolibacter rhizosphaerae]MCW1915535.1 hypothetical protein [Luteolibacter rhizosphaerae]